MSRTPVSEFNARMGLDISPLEQAVPRAIAQFKRLSAAQVALSSTTGGPDIQSISEKVARAASSVGRVGLEGGGSAQFKPRADELAFAAPLGDANEASLKRTALRQQEMQRAQKAASDAYMADVRMIDAALEQTAARQMQRAQERQDFEDSLAQRRMASAQAINEFETQRSTLIRNSARESAAAFQADFRATDERIAAEQEIAAIRRRQAQVQTASRFDQANPFQQQILSVQELNRLLVVRRGLQRGTVEFAQAELAVTQQIARVRGIRDNLTVGAEGMRRLGNTAADSQRGFARFGLGMQQVGYQVQDFAVQIASGTNALTALSQQGSQVLGFFGGFYGAVAGAALSVGILAYKLIDQAKGTEKAELKFKNLNDALKENIRLTREKVSLTDPSAKIGFLQGDADKANKQLDKNLAEQEKRQSAFNKANEAMGLQVSTGNADADQARAAALYVDMLLRKKQLNDAILVTENSRIEATGAELELAQELNKVISIRDAILNTLDRNRAPLVNEQELQMMLNLGSITKEQAKQTRLLAEYSKSRSETSLPDNEFAKLDALKHQLDILKKQRLEKTQAFKDTQDEYNATKKGILAIAQAYREQINPKPLVDEKQLRDLVTIEGGLLPSQVAQVKTLAQYSQARSEWSRPDDEFAKLDALQKQLAFLKQQGLEKTDAFKETQKEYDSTKKSLDDLAKKYKNQLDPLYEQKKVWKQISQLRDIGKMTPEEATAAQEKILKDINLARKLPDVMSNKGSVLSSGLMVGAASPNQLIDISRQMLKALQNLVSLETTGVKGYPV